MPRGPTVIGDDSGHMANHFKVMWLHLKSLLDLPDDDTDGDPLIESDDDDKALVVELRKVAEQAEELTGA
jgi:hypothetical protein